MCLAILPYLFVGMVTFSLDCLGDKTGNELHHPVVESSQQLRKVQLGISFLRDSGDLLVLKADIFSMFASYIRYFGCAQDVSKHQKKQHIYIYICYVILAIYDIYLYIYID